MPSLTVATVRPAPSVLSPYRTRSLYLRWILANVAGEFIGLGVAGGLGGALALVIQAAGGSSTDLVLLLILLVAASVEGLAVGASQWLVLRRPLAALRGRVWIGATVGGAIVAWLVGMGLGSSSDRIFAALSDEAAMTAMGIAMGPLVGAILGLAQWPALRPHVRAASWWIVANAAAWTAGMVVIFGLMALVNEGTPVAVMVLVWAFGGILAGAAVAAVHGLALVRLLRQAG